MGLLGKLLDKKECAICGGEIGLLGNRKLEDGDMCKECAKKLSPWFSERRKSSVEDIKKQLQYREENKHAVNAFQVTRSFRMGRGSSGYVLFLDENAGKFMVAHSENYRNSNPDVIDIAKVTSCIIDINESRQEEKRKNSQGENVSYNPPRYRCSYDFYVDIKVNHPWINEIRYRLNPSSIVVQEDNSGGSFCSGRGNVFDPEYQACLNMGETIKGALLNPGMRGQCGGFAPGYNQPQQGYNQPQQGYNQPQQGYNQPQQGYNQPQQGYNQPQQGYNQPQQGYNQPQQGYNQPQQGYNQPQQGYNQPQQGYNQPQQGYNQPQQGYDQPQQSSRGVPSAGAMVVCPWCGSNVERTGFCSECGGSLKES